MIGFYDYTVILTYLGFASGVFGILCAIKDPKHLFPAIFCLMFSGLCDMFDGKVARTKKRRTTEEKHFGIQLDSLSDLACFGILPAVIGYQLGMDKWYFLFIIVFFPIAALIRLAYFNVLEIVRNSSTPVKEYIGLPVTSSALIYPFIYIFKKFLGCNFVYLYAAVMLLVGVLFITKFKVKKPQMKTMLLFILIGLLEILLIIVVRKFL